MGVRGLTSFIEANDDLLKHYQLRECKLVIDGDNLIYYLYWLSSVVNGSHDHIFGGTYRLFGKIVRTFFSNLFRCEIEPIVVMDGGSYTSDVKQKTTVDRLTNQLRHCRIVSKRGVGNFSILPLLCKSVFKDIASELKVRVYQSIFEADNDILMIANYYECPVLSNDSDFFVFDLKAGFIPLKLFNFSAVKERLSTNGKHYFIDCIIYEIDSLLKHFPGLDKSLLPLFSCLVGNDYIEAIKCVKLLNSLPNADTRLRTRKLRVSAKQDKKMIQLLDWMRYKSKIEVTAQLASCLKVNERDSVLKLIDSVLNVYGLLEKNTNSNPVTGDELYFDQLSFSLNVPVCFLKKFSCGLIDSSAMNVLTMSRLILAPQVEDFSIPSFYDCCNKLFYYYFQVLSTKKNTDRHVVVFTRNDSGICKRIIEISKSELCLDAIELMDEKEETVLKLIYSCHSKFESTKKNLKVLIKDVNIRVKCEELNCVMHLLRYWLQETNKSHVYLEFVMAAIASIVCTVSVHSKAKETAIDEVNVKRNFQKFLTPFVPNHGNQFEARVVHLYNELQAIVLFFTRINSLLNFPLPHIRCEHIFDGILVYNLTIELFKRSNPYNFILDKFGVNTKLSLFFNFIYNFVIHDSFIERKQKTCVSKSKKKLKKQSRKSEELLSKFSVLEIDEC